MNRLSKVVVVVGLGLTVLWGVYRTPPIALRFFPVSYDRYEQRRLDAQLQIIDRKLGSAEGKAQQRRLTEDRDELLRMMARLED